MTDSELLAAIETRVADGIALGGNYDALFHNYVQAHKDREQLFRMLKHPNCDHFWVTYSVDNGWQRPWEACEKCGIPKP
jgi:hypothetical protein